MGAAGLHPIALRGALRARRWDALVLGSGAAGLVAAARLGMAGQRVLVVQEEAAAGAFTGLREPFFLAGARDGGILDACLRTLALALIDRRRIGPDGPAFQVVWPEFRFDVESARRNIDELVSWGLAKPEAADRWVRQLCEASTRTRDALLAAPLVQAGRGLGTAIGRSFGRGGAAPSGGKEPAEEAGAASPRRECLAQAQLRALSNLARSAPGPDARARLLGAPLAGGAGWSDGAPWLDGLLRRRVEAVVGEFRSIARGFRLVNADGQPGIEILGSGELWLGRALVIAAPAGALAAVLEPVDRPAFLSPRDGLRRRAFHLRLRRGAVPEAMARRVVWVGDPDLPFQGPNHWSLSLLPDRDEPDWLHLVARAVLEVDEEPESLESGLLEALNALFPFAGDGLASQRVLRPRWDDDGWLEDPAPGGGWPEEIPLRVSTRPPVYRLDRTGVAGLGLEGDLLLGWRAGDAIASDLG